MSETRRPPPAADRNLLFAVLALQMDFAGRDQVVEGMNAWALDKRRTLGEILCERGALSDLRRTLLDSLVEEHLRAHGGDARQCLDSITSRSTVTDGLAVGDPDAQSTLSELDPRARSTAFRLTPAANGSRYKRLRHHARGGLGEVFVAEDTELHREVAVKEIQPDRAFDESSRTRFLLEAEITGALEHPGVVPVYGLGAYPDGRPYYAMRFIRGDSLKAAIDRFHAAEGPGRPPAERAMAFRALLRRFVDVCNAVAYAHSRGVIHRDLKPQNVMLGKFGETLVLDWGLAKVGVERNRPDPDRDLTTDPSVHPASGSDAGTRAGAVLGTPGYMSPEQAAGRVDEVGPASDVYSLGATLYYLLTGQKPTDRTASTEPTSGSADEPAGRQPAPRVPAALEAVCRKAMAERPADRYPTPLALAADVERWVADEPVTVHRDRWPVRAARWGRRHRTAVAAAAVLLVTGLAASGLGTWLIWKEERRTAEQKRQAEENYELARDLSASGIDLVAANEAQFAADPVKHKARKELLVAAAKAFHKHLERAPGDPDVRRQAARVYRYAANVHRLEREYAAAEPVYRDAVELLEGLAAAFPDEPAYRLQLSETLRDQAKVQSTLGRLADAVATLTRSVGLADGLLVEDGENAWYRRARAAALLNRAAVEQARGRAAAATADARRAADLFADLDRVSADAHPYDSLLRAAAVNVQAMAERDAGRLDQAQPLHEAAIRIADGTKGARPGRNPNDVEHFRASFWFEQARTWAGAGRRADADRVFGLTAQTWDRLGKVSGAPAECREMGGVAHYERGRVREADGKPDAARPEFDKSLEILQAEAARCPDVPALSGELGRVYAALGRLARAGGDRAAAADWFGKAAAALQSAVNRAPDRAEDARDLKTVQAEAAR
jgi:eukaryotic-like serine/threonine-protein kinase